MVSEKYTINKNSLDHTNENFEYPSNTDVKNLRLALGLNRGEVGLIVGTFVDESGVNSATVRAWETDSNRARKIPLSAWYLLLVFAGVRPVNIDVLVKDRLIIK